MSNAVANFYIYVVMLLVFTGADWLGYTDPLFYYLGFWYMVGILTVACIIIVTVIKVVG